MFGHSFIPFRRFPQVFPVVTSILLVQTVIFIMLLSTGHMNDPKVWVQYGAYIDWRIEEGEWWRYISSTLLHVNFFQFLFITHFNPLHPLETNQRLSAKGIFTISLG